MCNSVDSMDGDDKEKGSSDGIGNERENKCHEAANGSQEKSFLWPDAAVPAVTALERTAHEMFSSDLKYNQKMRSMVFNLKVCRLCLCVCIQTLLCVRACMHLQITNMLAYCLEEPYALGFSHLICNSFNKTLKQDGSHFY